jgi:hypothetical protein
VDGSTAPREQTRFGHAARCIEGMPTVEDIVAPGRALESLLRRAARGHRPAWRLLLAHAPIVIEAESRWLYPALLHRRPDGARRAWLLPFAAEHEQILEVLEHLKHSAAGRADPMFRGAQWLMLRHARSEREWLVKALSDHRKLDDPALRRFVQRCRPLVDAVGALGSGSAGSAGSAGGDAVKATEATG